MLKILIVLYQKKIYESETIYTLKKNKNEIKIPYEVHIWNNSPTALAIQDITAIQTELPVIICGNDKKNTSLSIIYTKFYKSCNDDDILLILDHDTRIDKGFFSELEQAIKSHPNINLFLPIVKHNNLIVSPSTVYGVKGIYWKKAKYNIIQSQHTTAINSGMAIRCHYLKHNFEGYNLNLKFYETDNDFMHKYSKNNKYIYVLKSELIHSLGFYDDDVNSKLKRFEAMKFGRLTHMKTRKKILYILAYLQYLYFGIKCFFRYKDKRFLKSLFKDN